MGNNCSPGYHWWCLCCRLFVMSFFPLDVLDEIRDLIESVSEGFSPTLTQTDVEIWGHSRKRVRGDPVL